MGQMVHPLVPEFILTNNRAGNRQGHFLAVGLFVDISGFSTMTDVLMSHGQHGAEVLAEIMRTVLDPIIETIYGHGGFVCASAGDGLTALFPVNDDKSTAARHALSAAWEIQTYTTNHNTFDTPYQVFGVSVKVGLAPGEVYWGIILQEGGSGRGAFFFQGTAVDGCAAAEHHARAAEVILNRAMLDLVEEQVEVNLVAEPGPLQDKSYYRLLKVTGDLPSPVTAPLPEIAAEDAALFFPKALLTQGLSGEFRQVVNMFISLPTVSTESQLRIFMASLFALQEKWGGLINRLDFGDKGTNLLLFWGAPVAYENDIERALSFILDLQTITSIPINAGITYRISHAGFIGGRLYEEYTCYGRGINLAARFMMAAPRGIIWVDEPIAERAASKFEVEYIDERAFKGFSSPQKIFVLNERKTEQVNFFRGQMAGREREMAAVREFIAPLARGQYAGMLVVTGEPGIGKSRLVYEAVQLFQEDVAGGAQVFLGQTDEILRQSFNPFAYWLRRCLGVNDSQGEARSKRSFNRRLDDLIASTTDRALAAELDRTRSFLGALVSLHWPDSLYEQVDAERRYQNTQIALITLIQAFSLQSPVVFILEDIHWLDGDSAGLLSRLMRVLSDPGGPTCPVAILATSREASQMIRLDDTQVQYIALQGVDREALQSLANSLLSAPLAGSLLDLIAARAEGNPFFAEQILYYLRSEGRLALKNGAWTVEQSEIDALPVDINILLVARLDHLTHQVREAVQTAAVLGREFEVHLLSYMLKSPAVPPEVTAAERDAIWTALSEIRYIFKHSLLRDAAYQMQVHARRKTLHGLAFEAYHHFYAADLSGHYGVLAYHAEQAELHEEARHYLHLAGKAAYEIFQNGQAVEYYSRALALTPDTDLAGQYELLMAREEVLARMGHPAECEHDLAAAEALLPGLNQVEKEIDVLLRRGGQALDRSIFSDVQAYATQAARLAAENGMLEKNARALRQLGICAMRQGKFVTAGEYYQRGLELAREAQSLKQEMWLLNSIGLLEIEMNRYNLAEEAFTTALEITLQIGKMDLQAAVLNNLGEVKEVQGDSWSGQEFFIQANELSRKVGDRFGEGIAIGNLGFIAGKMGEYQRALIYYERALRISREIGDLHNEVFALINLSACLAALQEMDAAVAHARNALDLARKTGFRSPEAWALTYLGHGLIGQGKSDEAVEAYAASLAIRGELNQPALAAEPAAGLARAGLAQGNIATAIEHIQPVLDHLESGGNLNGCDEPVRVYLTLYQVLSQAGDPRAADMLNTAHSQLQERAAKIINTDTRASFLHNVVHHKEVLLAWETLHSMP